MSARKTVLITGASSGIGLACARVLADRGLRVFGSSRRPPPSEQPFEFVAMDVTDERAVVAAVEQVLAASGRLDVVINNAGHVLAGPLELTSIEEVHAQLDTNLLGPLRVVRAVAPHMRRQGSGLIVMVGSLGGLIGMPFQSAYSASKFALEGVTEALRHELRPFGVHATIVEPGDVATPITDKRRIAAALAEPHGAAYAETFRAIVDTYAREEREGVAAELVAARIARIIAHPRPRPRYAVGKLEQTAAVWLKRMLPARAFEWGIARYYGL